MIDFNVYVSSHFTSTGIKTNQLLRPSKGEKQAPVPNHQYHYNDVTMSLTASQITSLTIVYSTGYSDADQRKHQSSASLAFVRGIHRGPVNSPHKGPVTRENASIWWRHHDSQNKKASNTASTQLQFKYYTYIYHKSQYIHITSGEYIWNTSFVRFI